MYSQVFGFVVMIIGIAVAAVGIARVILYELPSVEDDSVREKMIGLIQRLAPNRGDALAISIVGVVAIFVGILVLAGQPTA